MIFKRTRTLSKPDEGNNSQAPEFVVRAGSGIDELFDQVTSLNKSVALLMEFVVRMAENQEKLDAMLRHIGKNVTPIPGIMDEYYRTIRQKIEDMDSVLMEKHIPPGPNGSATDNPAFIKDQLLQINKELLFIKGNINHSNQNRPDISSSGPSTDHEIKQVEPLHEPPTFGVDQLIQRIKTYKRVYSEEVTRGGRKLLKFSVDKKPHWYLVPVNTSETLFEVLEDTIYTRKQIESGPYYIVGAKRLSHKQLPGGLWIVICEDIEISKLSAGEWQKLSKMTRESGVMVVNALYADNVGRIAMDLLDILRVVVEVTSATLFENTNTFQPENTKKESMPTLDLPIKDVL